MRGLQLSFQHIFSVMFATKIETKTSVQSLFLKEGFIFFLIISIRKVYTISHKTSVGLNRLFKKKSFVLDV